jgi:hypothetical protein
MKKIKSFLFAFCWMLSCQIIVSDLGIYTEGTIWAKYATAVVLGLIWTLFFQPMFQKRKLEKDNL